jgi:glycine cleavage system H lipoate-binding protein
MTCPFLREAQVKFCQAAPVRKLIPLAQCGRADEKCSSNGYTGCRIFLSQADAGCPPGLAAGTPSGCCPHLGESLMQYCAAAPVTRFVPYSESVLSRCGNDSFRYCELYLSMAHPALASEDVDGIPVPGWLSYSANHMWLDVAEDGSCHAGIDAFLSRALGPVERVSYVWMKGEHRAAAILTAAGIDFEVVFPNPLRIVNCNLYLRANPARLSNEPYTGGWLFEGAPSPEAARGLIQGAEARVWMEQEERRMNQSLQEQTAGCAADGGLFARGVVAQLTRERAVGLFHEFFSAWGDSREHFHENGKREL